MKYLLIVWPYSQNLMDKEWFNECCLANQEGFPDSSYFVPEIRINSLSTKELNDIMDGILIP